MDRIAGGRIRANEDARCPGEDLGIHYIRDLKSKWEKSAHNTRRIQRAYSGVLYNSHMSEKGKMAAGEGKYEMAKITTGEDTLKLRETRGQIKVECGMATLKRLNSPDNRKLSVCLLCQSCV